MNTTRPDAPKITPLTDEEKTRLTSYHVENDPAPAPLSGESAAQFTSYTPAMDNAADVEAATSTPSVHIAKAPQILEAILNRGKSDPLATKTGRIL